MRSGRSTLGLEEPETQAETTAQGEWEQARLQIAALSKELEAAKQAQLETTVALTEELGRLRQGLEVEVGERRTAAAGLAEAVEAESAERRRLGSALRRLEAAKASSSASGAGAGAGPCGAAGGGPDMGDARQCWESESLRLAGVVDAFQAELGGLAGGLASERGAAAQAQDAFRAQLGLQVQTARGELERSCESRCSRIEEKLVALEKNVVRSGLTSLTERLEDIVRAVPEEVSRASLAAMEAHMDHLASSIRRELCLQEERIIDGSLRAVEARLGDLAATTHVRVSGATSPPMPLPKAAHTREGGEAADASEVCMSPQVASRGELRRLEERLFQNTTEPLGIRMNELGCVLREEFRRQDALESRLQELAGTFHDELRRQEDVVLPEALEALERRLERFADLLREELRRLEDVVLRSGLAAFEAQLGDLAARVREADTWRPATEALSKRLEAVGAEATARGLDTEALRSRLGDVEATVKGLADREGDLWNALDTHTHDVTVNAPPAAPAAPSAPSAPSAPPTTATTAVDRRLTTASSQGSGTPSACFATTGSNASHGTLHNSGSRAGSVPVPSLRALVSGGAGVGGCGCGVGGGAVAGAAEARQTLQGLQGLPTRRSVVAVQAPLASPYPLAHAPAQAQPAPAPKAPAPVQPLAPWAPQPLPGMCRSRPSTPNRTAGAPSADVFVALATQREQSLSRPSTPNRFAAAPQQTAAGRGCLSARGPVRAEPMLIPQVMAFQPRLPS